MDAVRVQRGSNREPDVIINTVPDEIDTLVDVSDPLDDNVLDDKLLDAVNPRLSLVDEPTDSDIKPTFCTRCRTISASFLSSPYGSQENTHGSHERCPMRDSHPRITMPFGEDTVDDVPLLRDEDGDVEQSQGDGMANNIVLDHCHMPRLSHKASRTAMTKLAMASCLTTMFMIGEVVGGYLANSIAIMSDAAHLLTDLTSFIVSLIAIYLAMRPASKKMNFGYYRAEVLGAVVSVLFIWVITGILVYAAIQRVITMDFEVEADTMIIVAAIGVVINIILGIVLHMGSGHGHGHSHGGRPSHSHSHSDPQQNQQQNVNVRAAFIHVLGDLIQSIGVLIAAYVIRFYPEYKIADPICTFIFSILVICTTVPILRDLSVVLMEGAPPGVDYAAVSSNLAALPGVKMVHSLHVWALTLDKNACSVHLAIGPDTDPDVVLNDAQKLIRTRHQIFHTTIQVERYQPDLMDNCQQCQPLT